MSSAELAVEELPRGGASLWVAESCRNALQATAWGAARRGVENRTKRQLKVDGWRDKGRAVGTMQMDGEGCERRGELAKEVRAVSVRRVARQSLASEEYLVVLIGRAKLVKQEQGQAIAQL